MTVAMNFLSTEESGKVTSCHAKTKNKVSYFVCTVAVQSLFLITKNDHITPTAHARTG